jgi:hypothetical protein
VPPHLPADLEAVDTRKHQVEDHQVRDLVANLGQTPHLGERNPAVGDVADSKSLLLEVVLEKLDDVLLVLDDEYSSRHDHSRREEHIRPRLKRNV